MFKEEILLWGKEVLRKESVALSVAADRLDESFIKACKLLSTIEGHVIVTGVGKCLNVAQKVSSTFNSNGISSFVLDPVAALHGDLGCVRQCKDVILILSHSGESEEIVHLLGPLDSICPNSIVAITNNPDSTLSGRADVTIDYGPLSECCPLGLSPSSSTIVMMAIGDALAFAISRSRGFTRDKFSKFHPAGSLGRKLQIVKEVMRTGPLIRIAGEMTSIRTAVSTGPNRRVGAVMVVDKYGKLSGIFTDSDLVRLIDRSKDKDILDLTLLEVMNTKPIFIREDSFIMDAIEILRSCKISELPVIDYNDKPTGIIDITDIITLMPGLI